MADSGRDELGAQALDVPIDRPLVAFVAHALDYIQQVEARENPPGRGHQRGRVEFEHIALHDGHVVLPGQHLAKRG